MMRSEVLNERRISVESELSQIARDLLMFVSKNDIEKDLSNFKEVQKVRVAIQGVLAQITADYKDFEGQLIRLENEIINLRDKQAKLRKIVELECELKYLKDTL